MLKNDGYKIFSIEQASKTTFLQDLPNDKKPIALIFGNEVDGVSNTAIQHSDAVIEIPQFGTKHSLNVSVCGGAVLWEATKQFI